MNRERWATGRAAYSVRITDSIVADPVRLCLPISGEETPSSPFAGGFQMWRSIFIAIGIMAVIIGVECMMIESANLYSASETQARTFLNPISAPSANTREWRPQEWFPWAILSAGVIVVLYAITLPRHWSRPAES